MSIISMVALVLVGFGIMSCEPNEANKDSSNALVPNMKMTTEIPEGIETPNKLDTEIGELNFFDGVPVTETERKVYDYYDLHNGFEAFLKGIQMASMEELKRGIVSFGTVPPKGFEHNWI